MQPGTKVKLVQVPSSYREWLTRNQKGVFQRLSTNTPDGLHLVRMDDGKLYGFHPFEISPLDEEDPQ